MVKQMMRIGSLLVLASALSTVACSGANFEGDDLIAEESDSEFETSTEALGESTCGSMACTAANSCSALEVNQCGAASFQTVSPPYGSALCPGQAVVQDKTPPTNGGRIVPMFRWSGATLTALNCASAKVEAALYARTSATPSPTPVLVGKETYKGVWSGTACTLTSTDGKPFVQARPGLLEVRATASAKLGNTQQKVRVGFWHTGC